MRTFLVRAGARQRSKTIAGSARSAGTAWFARALLVVALVLSFGCVGTKPPKLPTALPAYTPEDAALFDDVFRPELFGYPGVQAPELDRHLAARVVRSGSVGPAKVVTVTLEGDSARRNYSVVVQPAGGALAGKRLTDSVTLTVTANSPIFGLVEGASQTFVGTHLMLFVRLYENGPHFHASVDTPAVREAIARARIPPPRSP